MTQENNNNSNILNTEFASDIMEVIEQLGMSAFEFACVHLYLASLVGSKPNDGRHVCVDTITMRVKQDGTKVASIILADGEAIGSCNQYLYTEWSSLIRAIVDDYKDWVRHKNMTYIISYSKADAHDTDNRTPYILIYLKY